jgi:hypothetical protein
MMQMKINRGGKATGMTSSLVFAPNQGIQLVDPSYVKSYFEKQKESKFFSEKSGFRTVIENKSQLPTL